jgi:hypothetical protein
MLHRHISFKGNELFARKKEDGGKEEMKEKERKGKEGKKGGMTIVARLFKNTGIYAPCLLAIIPSVSVKEGSSSARF